jgi:hypothetical protein
MTHGDSTATTFVTREIQVDPAVLAIKPELFPITRQGAALYCAAFRFYEAVLGSPLDITPEAFGTWQHPGVGRATLDLLDACHDALESHPA